MNIEKRRKTTVEQRDFVHKNALKPLLEDMEILKPEYKPEANAQLYELTMKKRRDTDKIPVHISLFGNYLNTHSETYNSSSNHKIL